MILVVQSLWNRTITDRLAEGAAQLLREADLPYQILQVPGALEIPLAIQWAQDAAVKKHSPLRGVIACGTVVKGDTYHFEIVANESSRKLVDLSLELKIPITNAILAVYNVEQAIERTGGNSKFQNKGEEAAEALVAMLKIQHQLHAH
jgi:6,7-dimethyl-8-ribityllumazine synthase